MSSLKKNMIAGLCKQLFAIVYGFIVPRLILGAFGSTVNGLIGSISQFLGLISYLELGMGTVVQSALYAPLAQNNADEISRVMSSASKFFKTLGRILFFYVIVLVFAYPTKVHTQFSFWYVALIILALSINSFAQYYFGIVNATFLRAAQVGYIYDFLSVLAYTINIVLSFAIIHMRGSIQLLEFVTACVYLIRPLYIFLYVRNNYSINYNIQYKVEPIKQKWNGVAQHFSAIVIDGTDIVVLTLFSTLQNVSVYNVYNMVVVGVRTLVLSITHGVSAHFGKMIAEGNQEKLFNDFKEMDWILNTVSVIIFGCTSVLIVPFVRIYTKGVNDTNYIVPGFAILITLAQLFRCIRLPYNVVILSAGHFKQTQCNYIIAAFVNIAVSVLMVRRHGLIGVAVGTLVAFIYQDIWMALYVSNNIVHWPFTYFIRQNIVNVSIAIIATLILYLIELHVVSALTWIMYALVVSAVWLGVSIAINYLFYKDMVLLRIKKLFKLKE